MKKGFLRVLPILFSIFFLVPLSEAKTNDAIKASYLKLPLSFIKNEGQKDRSILFYTQGAGHETAFTAEGVSFFLRKSGTINTARPGTVTLTPLDSSPFTVEPLDKNTAKVSYFIGRDPSKWKTGIPTYGAILYKNIYPGIDMKFYGTNSQLEYDIVVSPHADPGKVRLAYKGIEKLSLTPEGDLEIILAGGSIYQKKLFLYQMAGGNKTRIQGSFVLLDKTTYGFEVGPYDKEQTLVIDPGLGLAYSTYLGGSDNDTPNPVAVDASGNIYVAGYTNSANFPVTPGAFQTSSAGMGNAFVSKLNPDGTALVYSTYLGGSGGDSTGGISVDASGNVYVTGNTSSVDFPVTPGAFQTAYGGSFFDGFVAKLNPDGTALVYSTYLGGSGADTPGGIAIDSSGNAYVTGRTDSANFPVTPGAYQTAYAGGGGDGFVTKLNPDGTALVYSTYLGGSGLDHAWSIAVDPAANAYVSGYTDSANFPVTPGAHQTAYAGGGGDGFVTKLNPDGTALVYSTYLGGSDTDFPSGIALDSSGNAFVAGYTLSSDFTTTSNAPQRTYAGDYDGFITKLNADGTALVYSTYLGGSGSDFPLGIALDSFGNAYAAGRTSSTDFPVTQNAYQAAFKAVDDGFITKLNADGTALVYSTYLGGSGSDTVTGIAVNSSGKTYVTGYTNSGDFPVTQDAFQTTYGGGTSDAFVARLGSTLNVIISGSGSVASSPSGIDCGSACSAAFNVGELVTLTATAEAGYVFAYWSGGCSGASAACVIAMSEDIATTAVFDSVGTKQYRLTVSKKRITGGDGTVTSDDGVIQCGKTCGRKYYLNTPVTLTAHPSGNASFAAWGGACSGKSLTCVVAMDDAKTVTAAFASPQRLTVNKHKASSGNGAVVSDPSGINCDAQCAAANVSYTYGEIVTLTATADPDTVFTGWSPSSACTAKSANTCTVTMDRAKTMTAKFDGPRLLTVKKASANEGSGRVTSSPGGIDCGDTCGMTAAYFIHDGTVVLTAEPDPGSSFAGWSPAGVCASTGPGTCTITMDRAKTVTARFTR